MILSVAAGMGVAGCGGAAARNKLSSGNPLDRARGVIEVSEARDAKAVHKLVDLLEDPDTAVRMYAIIALRRLCGRDFGYHYYADESSRAIAVQRWREALRMNELVVLPDGQADARDADSGVADAAPAIGAAATAGGGKP